MAQTKVKLIEDNAIKAVHIDETATGITLADLTVNDDVVINSTTGNALKIDSSQTFSGLFFDNTTSSFSPYIYAFGDDLEFGNLGGGMKMRIESNGDVGIGTTTIQNSTSGRGNITLNGASSAIINLSTSNTLKSYLYTDGTNTELLSTGDLRLSAGGSEIIRIDSSGNVGINTDSPQGKLNIYGGRLVIDNTLSNQSAIQFNHAGTEMAVLYRAGGESDKLRMFIEGFGDVMTWANTGRVGIGTNAPQARLQIVNPANQTVVPAAGTGATQGVIISNDLNTYGMFVGSTGDGKGYIQQQRTDSATYYDLLLQANGGRVGIGTTAPNASLEVNGDAWVNTLRTKASGIDGFYGAASFSWGGSTSYPTLYSDNADRWVMICNPHIPYLQNGVNGYTGGTGHAKIRMAGQPSATSYWDMGVISNDAFGISRMGSSFVDIYSNGNTHFRQAAFFDNWVRPTGNTGLYFETYGRGIRDPQANGQSYGNIATYGGGFNGWEGYTMSNNMSFMGTGVQMGLYDAGAGVWELFYRRDFGGMSINGAFSSDFYSLYVFGNVWATGTVTWASDERLKENIADIDSPLDKVKSLKGVYYNLIDDDKKTKEIGFIAQRVYEHVPELVIYAEDTDEWSVKYGQVTALHNEAIKELSLMLEEKDSEIKNLQAQIDELRNLITQS